MRKLKALLALAVALGALAVPAPASARLAPAAGRYLLGHATRVTCWNPPGHPNTVYCNYPGWRGWCKVWLERRYGFAWRPYYVVRKKHGPH